MQLSFNNMTIELNIFNIAKQPLYRDEGIVGVDLIEELINNPLQTCLTDFGLNFDINRSIDKVNALLDSLPSMGTNKSK